jgi:Spy/CpxP family protein refolding chaperone
MNAKLLKRVMSIGITCFTLSGCQHGQHHKAHHDPTRALEHISDRLDLSEAQKSEVAKIVKELATQKQEMESMKRGWYDEATAQLNKPAIDQKRLDAFIVLQKSQTGEIMDKAAAAFVRFHGVLTPEQRRKLADEINNHEARHNDL